MGAHEKTIAVPEETPPVLQSLEQDEIVVEMLSLNQCLQAGPLKPILRDKHLTLKSFLGHLGFESLREAENLTNLAGGLSQGDGGSWDVPESPAIRGGALATEKLSEGGHRWFLFQPHLQGGSPHQQWLLL